MQTPDKINFMCKGTLKVEEQHHFLMMVKAVFLKTIFSVPEKCIFHRLHKKTINSLKGRINLSSYEVFDAGLLPCMVVRQQ